jgi:hypothetical protein
MTLIALFFVVGFILNGIKGLYIYALTFLVIKDGQILRRDPAIDPVPPFDVPLVLNALIVGIIVILASIIFCYIVIKKRIRVKKSKN